MSDDTSKTTRMKVKVVSEATELEQQHAGGRMWSYEADVETEDGTRLTIYSHGAVATKMNQHVNGGLHRHPGPGGGAR